MALWKYLKPEDIKLLNNALADIEILKNYYYNNLMRDGTALIPNQIIQSPVPLTSANLHLLDGVLLSGDGAYAKYVAMMGELYNADPTATCWTTESDWQTSLTTYGECGKFVYDSESNTLRLPKLTSFVQAINSANELGSLVEAGLPNITGKIQANGTYSIGCNESSISEGALFAEDYSNPSASGTSSKNYMSRIRFDASNSNSIYGNSETVQPQAIKYYFYIVVGTVSKTDILIDIDNVLADLANKADKDLSNVTAPTQAFKDMVTSWGMPDYSSGINITSSLGQGQTWTAPENGILILTSLSDNGSCFISHTNANSHTNYNLPNWLIYNNTGSGDYQSAMAIVNKNMVVYGATSSGISGTLMFYPFK